MIYQQYEDNIQRAKEEIQFLTTKINRNSFARLFVIIGGGALLFYSFQQNNVLLVLVLTLIIVLTFVFLIKRQSVLEKQRNDNLAFLQINENELTLRNERRNVYDDGARFDDGKHPYASDLDLFGPFSLFSLLNRCATLLGVSLLAEWLQQAAAKPTILERQQAADEISQDLGWSQNFQSRLVFNLSQKTEAKSFLARYFQDSSLSFGNVFMKSYVFLAPIILGIITIISIFVYPLWSFLAILAIVHLLWTIGMGGRVSAFSSKIDKIGTILAAYAEGLEMLEKRTFTAVRNKYLQQQLLTGEKHLSKAFKELSSLIDSLDARNNMLVGALLNMLFLWDFKYVMKIVDWKGRYKATMLVACDVIAEFEALNSLAILKRNHPDWVTPVIADATEAEVVIAENIIHPLIPAKSSVANDYSSEDHRIALITGSNMAGKSTFLRTIGINAVLAYAGAVCSATVFNLPIYHLISYMRIKDSLNESTSTFKAELDRMKFILETVDRDKRSFFLIDEMLRGTNSVDKYLGSRAIIRKLIAMEGRGMVATHDLQLATLEEEYAGAVRNYHFDIQIQASEMLFDYKLKHGRCTIFNASMLLKGIGIDVDSVDNG